jgi:hypothetical protein
MLSILLVARLTYPHPEEMESHPPNIQARGLPRVFFAYLVGAVLVGKWHRKITQETEYLLYLIVVRQT